MPLRHVAVAQLVRHEAVGFRATHLQYSRDVSGVEQLQRRTRRVPLLDWLALAAAIHDDDRRAVRDP